MPCPNPPADWSWGSRGGMVVGPLSVVLGVLGTILPYIQEHSSDAACPEGPRVRPA